jgi:creatinine amidohydrolase
MSPAPVHLLSLDSRSAERALARGPLVILPVGALEAHGPHLPLGADQLQAERMAELLAERTEGLVAPAIPYGVCPGARAFPGTVSISMRTLGRLAEELLGELARMGVRRVLVLSGHGEGRHMAALREAADRAHETHPQLRVLVLSEYDFVYELRGTEAPATDGHGGLLETSLVLATAPSAVGADRPHVVDHRGPHRLSGAASAADWPESVVGDTREASVALGERVQAHVLGRVESTVRALLPA